MTLTHSVGMLWTRDRPVADLYLHNIQQPCPRQNTSGSFAESRFQLKCDGRSCRMGGEVKGKLANGVDRHYSSQPLMRTTRLPAVNGTDAPANLNGLVRFAERRNLNICACAFTFDRLCGIVVRVSGYRYRGLGFNSRRYQIF